MNTNPPVSGYDEAPEEGEGEKAGRMAYIAAQRPKKGSWQDVFGHLGTPEEVGNMWHALTERAEKAERMEQLLTERVDRVEAQRPALYHADTEIKVNDNGPTFEDDITLWKIRGVPRTFYPTKMAAEVAARAHFPHDNPTVRYSRITFTTIVLEPEEE